MNSECLRIADQLRQAFVGDPWLGPSLGSILKSVTAEQACCRLSPGTHTIEELVAHIDFYVTRAAEAVSGSAMPRLYGGYTDWPEVVEDGGDAWPAAVAGLIEHAEELAAKIEAMDDSQLSEVVSGRGYHYYFLLHGVVQHSVYHGGQITLISRALAW